MKYAVPLTTATDPIGNKFDVNEESIDLELVSQLKRRESFNLIPQNRRPWECARRLLKSKFLHFFTEQNGIFLVIFSICNMIAFRCIF